MRAASRLGPQTYVDKLSDFVLNYHIDPTGNQNDVKYLSKINTLCMFCISGTVPTYGADLLAMDIPFLGTTTQGYV